MSQKPVADCLVISANQVVSPYPVYPLGAAYVANALVENGHVVTHFDLLADGGLEALKNLLSIEKYDLVAVSIRNIDSVDSCDPKEYLQDICQTVRGVREKQDTTIVIGGPAVSIMPEELMELLQADYGVVGEGEKLLPWLADEIIAGRKPEQKLFRAEFTEMCWGASRLTPSTSNFYTERGGMLNVQSKRGCPYTCSYCSYPTIEGKRIRYRDPESVADEFMKLQVESNAKYIFFTDSVFNDPQKKHLELAEALIRRGNKLPWCAFFRPSDITTEELRLLKRSGLSSMELGTDAATNVTLKGINKLFSFEDALEVHNRVIAEEIPCAHFIMFGGPGENESTLKQGLKNIEQLKKSVVFAYVGIRILPGTKIYDIAIDEGIIKPDQNLLSPQYYYSSEISREKIDTQIRASFEGQMDRIYPCFEAEQRVAMLHKIGQVGPVWDLLLKKGRR